MMELHDADAVFDAGDQVLVVSHAVLPFERSGENGHDERTEDDGQVR
jgi:hypothetical protein